MGSEDIRKKPVVEVADSGYQPTKAEMGEEVSIDATPEELARAVVMDVEVKVVDPKKSGREFLMWLEWRQG